MRTSGTHSIFSGDRLDSSDSLPSSHADFLKMTISKVAFLIFNAFAFICSPVFWGIGFFAGIAFRVEVKSRITDFFSSIIRSHLSWQLVLPTASLMYWFCLPSTLMMQALFAGAAFGSEMALRAEQLIKENKSVLNWWSTKV